MGAAPFVEVDYNRGRPRLPRPRIPRPPLPAPRPPLFCLRARHPDPARQKTHNSGVVGGLGLGWVAVVAAVAVAVLIAVVMAVTFAVVMAVAMVMAVAVVVVMDVAVRSFARAYVWDLTSVAQSAHHTCASERTNAGRT